MSILEPNIALRPVSESSDRSFGFVFAAVFMLIGGWPLLTGVGPRWWAFTISAAFVLAAVVQPNTLRLLNRAWIVIGHLLHRIVSLLVLSAVFFLCVTPIAWIIRLRGKDVLSLARRAELSTYWITREPSPPPSETMKRQF